MKTLESKVKSLSASVAKLKSDVGTLTARSSCLGAQGVTQFGNPAAGQGYAYTNDGGNTLVLTTAFDAPASGQTPTFYAATVNPSCVTGSDNRAFRLGHAVATHGTAPLPSP